MNTRVSIISLHFGTELIVIIHLGALFCVHYFHQPHSSGSGEFPICFSHQILCSFRTTIVSVSALFFGSFASAGLLYCELLSEYWSRLFSCCCWWNQSRSLFSIFTVTTLRFIENYHISWKPKFISAAFSSLTHKSKSTISDQSPDINHIPCPHHCRPSLCRKCISIDPNATHNINRH